MPRSKSPQEKAFRSDDIVKTSVLSLGAYAGYRIGDRLAHLSYRALRGMTLVSIVGIGLYKIFELNGDKSLDKLKPMDVFQSPELAKPLEKLKSIDLQQSFDKMAKLFKEFKLEDESPQGVELPKVTVPPKSTHSDWFSWTYSWLYPQKQNEELIEKNAPEEQECEAFDDAHLKLPYKMASRFFRYGGHTFDVLVKLANEQSSIKPK